MHNSDGNFNFFILLFDDPMHPLKVKKDPSSKKDILGK